MSPAQGDDGASASTRLGRILLVDDQAQNRDMLGRRLERRGYEVVLRESAIDKGLGKGNPIEQKGMGGGPAEGNKQDGKEKLEEDPPAGFVFYNYDWGALCDLNPLLFLVAMIPIVLLGCYSALVCFCGIKAQNLESRPWGIAGSILAMVPLNSWCPIMVLTILFKFAVYMVLDVSDGLAVFLVMVWLFVVHLIYPLSLGSGIWTLVTLNKPEVVAGFEYEGE